MKNKPTTLPILQRILNDIKTIKKWHDIEKDTQTNYYTAHHDGKQLCRYSDLETVVKLLIQAETAKARVTEMDTKYPASARDT